MGGIRSALQPGRLSAYLFSDRGIYRPGEEIRAGLVVKAQDWARTSARKGNCCAARLQSMTGCGSPARSGSGSGRTNGLSGPSYVAAGMPAGG